MVDDASILVVIINRILGLVPVTVEDGTEIVPAVDLGGNRSGYVVGVDVDDAKRLCSLAVPTDVFSIKILEVPPVASVVEVYYSEACFGGGYRTLATEDRCSLSEEVDWCICRHSSQVMCGISSDYPLSQIAPIIPCLHILFELRWCEQ